MNLPLTKLEAIKFLGLDEKLFENYFRNACEFGCLERLNGRCRFYFDKEQLRKWLDDFHWRTIELNMADYQLCLDFALAQHFRGYVVSDWGTARQREFGQKLTNWIKGQLAEVAVKKFFKNEFGAEIELDFAIHDAIVPQDIIGVSERGRIRQPKVGIGIKASKPKSAYLVLGENEVIKAVKDEPHFPTYKDKIPHFIPIPCEIAGYCSVSELEKVSGIEGQAFDNGFRNVKKSGLLHRSRKDWKQLFNLI